MVNLWLHKVLIEGTALVDKAATARRFTENEPRNVGWLSISDYTGE